MDTSNVNKTGYDSWLKNMFRIGYVSSQNTDDTQAACRVVYPDRENLVSEPLPILQKSTRGDQDYWSPEVGQQVLTLHLPNGIQKGFILGGFQSTADPPPVTDTNKRHTTFRDGTVVEFDKASSVFFADTKGPITIITAGPVYVESAGEITVKAPTVTMEANEITLKAPTITLDGTVTVTDGLNMGTSTAAGGGGTCDIVGNIRQQGDFTQTGRHTDSFGGHTGARAAAAEDEVAQLAEQLVALKTRVAALEAKEGV